MSTELDSTKVYCMSSKLSKRPIQNETLSQTPFLYYLFITRFIPVGPVLPSKFHFEPFTLKTHSRQDIKSNISLSYRVWKTSLITMWVNTDIYVMITLDLWLVTEQRVGQPDQGVALISTATAQQTEPNKSSVRTSKFRFSPKSGSPSLESSTKSKISIG